MLNSSFFQEEEKDYKGPNPRELLEPLFKQSSCSYRVRILCTFVSKCLVANRSLKWLFILLYYGMLHFKLGANLAACQYGLHLNSYACTRQCTDIKVSVTRQCTDIKVSGTRQCTDIKVSGTRQNPLDGFSSKASFLIKC